MEIHKEQFPKFTKTHVDKWQKPTLQKNYFTNIKIYEVLLLPQLQEEIAVDQYVSVLDQGMSDPGFDYCYHQEIQISLKGPKILQPYYFAFPFVSPPV